jgi:hypothetical protein
MLDQSACCSRCGFRITPADRTIRVVDELESIDVHGACAIPLLTIPGITIVVPRPAEVPA